jgi:hypothetical protein
MVLKGQKLTETQNTTVTEKLRNSFKPIMAWLVIFVVLIFVMNVVVYSGFFIGTPSSATFLNNFDDFERVRTWSNFKTTYPALDPQTLRTNYNVMINVTNMNVIEEFTRPKDFLLFHVKIKTSFEWMWLKLPSILVLFLDQNERIRGKLYVQQTSEDYFLTGQNETEYTFWYRIPSNMRGQNYRIVVELFGVIDSTRSIDYSRIKPLGLKPQPFSEHDDYYGNLPSWYYKDDSITNEYRYLNFLAFTDSQATIPEFVSIYGLALGAWTITGIIVTFSVFIVVARQKIKSYWERNKVIVSFAILFIIFLEILFVIFVLTH